MDDKLGRAIKPGDFGVVVERGYDINFVIFGGHDDDTKQQQVFLLQYGISKHLETKYESNNHFRFALKVPKSAVPKNLYSEKNPKWQQLLDAGIGVYVGKS